MPIADRFVHALAIVTPTDDVGIDTDEYGQPVPGIPTTTTAAGLIQPKTAREMALISQAGAQLADHVIFLAIDAPVVNASYLRYEPDDGDRYQVSGVRVFDFGRDPHLEVDCRRITSDVLVAS